MRTRSWWSGWEWTLAGLIGCTPAPSDGVATRRAEVVLAERGQSFDYAFVPARAWSSFAEQLASAIDAEAAWQKELRELGAVNQATGALLGAALDAQGNPRTVAGRPDLSLRYTCGATLVSPSFAVTAAHCVADDVGPLTLELYRPTSELEQAVSATLPLSGRWPDFEHRRLEADDGYLFDEYPCEIVVRCDERWGAPIDCPHGDATYDVAILRCEGRPGDRHGHVRVADELPPEGSETFLPWKHEVYDLEASTVSADELVEHYLVLGEPEDNYHYQGGGRNQLFPLRSIPWADGTPRTHGEEGWTDVMGCHGTSGSGFFVGDGADYRLWGIATSGSEDLADRLCQDTASRLAEGEGPGSNFIGSNWLEPGVLWQQVRDDLLADCAETRGGTRRAAGSFFDGLPYAITTWYSSLECQPLTASTDPTAPGWSFAAAGGESVVLADAQTVAFGPFELVAGRAYRVGGFATRPSPCADACSFQMSVGADVVGHHELDGDQALAVHVGDAFIAGESVRADLVLRNDGEPIHFAAPTVIAEGQANTFDTPHDRLEASLYTMTPTGDVGPAPMRFTGDGDDGFSALLFSGERLLLDRQALLGGRLWTVRLEASEYAGLSCGFVSTAGEPLLFVPCAPVFTLDASAVAEVPGAFAVEVTSSLSRVEVGAVALASDATADEDGDDVADVLDDCPGRFNPEQAGCALDEPGDGDGGTDAGAQSVDAGAHDAGVEAREAGVFAPASDAAATDADDAGPVSGGGGSGSGPALAGGASGSSDGAAGASVIPEPAGGGTTEPRPGPDAGVHSARGPEGCACRVTRAPDVAGIVFALFLLTTSLLRRGRARRDRSAKRRARASEPCRAHRSARCPGQRDRP